MTVRVTLVLVLVWALAGPSQGQSLEAAAQLTGLTSGMAQACKLQATGVLHAFRELMERKKVGPAQRKRLITLVSESSDRGFANEHQPGAMSCAEVKQQIGTTIRRLKRAR